MAGSAASQRTTVLRREPRETWWDYAGRIYRIWRGARHLRYARWLLMAGVALLTPTFVELCLLVVSLFRPDEGPRPSIEPALLVWTFGVGVFCILCSVAVFVYFEIRREKTQQKSASAKQRERVQQLQAEFVGVTRALVAAFRDPTVKRHSGYQVPQIARCRDLAVELLQVAPPEVIEQGTLAKIANNGLDASLKVPFWEVSLEEMERLAEQLEKKDEA